ncbi:MAG TPA: DUF3108 domain-containing protein [Chitinophagaceae bacterium]|nr:DUF3108 domain-containing protein [Chitinophagaceae bacterium]
MNGLIKLIAVPAIGLLAFSNRAETHFQDHCAMRNTAFLAGEKIVMTVYYAVAGIYVNAGTATFTNSLETLNNKPVYHIVGDGRSNSSYDVLYKVRDRYETYIDTTTLQPLKFVRDVNEGGYKKYQNVTFNKTANTAITKDGVFKVPTCVQDVVSAVFYARNIDFSKLQPNDRIAFDMFLDNEVFNMYIRYLGKETIKTKYGKFRAIKFKPLLIKGTIFEGGEQMVVWVTDDENHIPVRIESPISVGKVKIDMMSHENLRYPLTSLIRRRD